jgi:hypothetical protein
MRKWLLMVGAVIVGVTGATNQASARSESAPAREEDHGAAVVPLASTETASSCSTQAELRSKAERTCEARHALLTKVHFADLCGASGAEPMYMTVTFDCYKKPR